MDNGKRLPPDLRGTHIHFVGIKGTGMAALVEILTARGAVITGSDVQERFYTDEILERLSIRALPFDAGNITDSVQYVVYSSAYSPEKNPDLAEAVRRQLPMLLYSEALGALSATAYSCGVCGVHGKTTTTGLVGTILKELDFPAQVLAGSIIASFGGSCTMTASSCSSASAPYFVAETCEYQRHFMAFSPQKIILTSVESDHQDYYPTYEDIRAAFVDYICKLPRGGQLVYCADDKGAAETALLARQRRQDIALVPYGETASGDYRITFGSIEGGCQHFSLAALGDCALRVPGTHNVRNAAAAAALCMELLKEDGRRPADYADGIRRALLAFAGGKRRSEIVGQARTPAGQDVIFIDDYGHHPTAIRTTLEGYRAFYRGHKIIVDFMSHTYTRTQALLEEFASCFGSADEVIVNKIYGSAREDASAAQVTGESLARRMQEHHGHVTYAAEFDEAAASALRLLSAPSGASYPDGYLFVTMGAGDNWKVGAKLLERLGEHA
ncbi:MAG TPA: UDP-N-acetylmuramate--L-alanine ligase [Treponema sp.]|nr:UDP-N-acetylmuramate--L-alanine ligase [Treponema sp.]